MSHGIVFARASYEAVDASRNPLLRSVRRSWRNKIASWVIAEWTEIPRDMDKRLFQVELTKRVKAKVRQNKVGFWLPLAMMVAQIIIKILIERWFRDE